MGKRHVEICHTHNSGEIYQYVAYAETAIWKTVKASGKGHRFCPPLFSRKSKMFRMSMPSSLRKVGCIPPTMTTF